eukprot:TRINITY_DN55577_c0_g1_i1.p1 TRINITY_DN55577_c0_g1~~TRINITY_DN55577_c0_g1_i1.p1  ORF type:complete len:478 (+),score=160.48 TRINITY_DN55577_c0_g1_i1:77-1510(+)
MGAGSEGGALRCLATPKRQAVLMGIIFLLTFTAYDTIQVYAKRLYPGDLGSNMTLAIYAAFTLCEFVAPAIVNYIGCRSAMCIGILGYGSLVLAGLIYFETGYAPGIVMTSGVLLGLGAGLLWTGQGRLILEYGSGTDRGIVFGIFWALYRLASVAGGLLSYTYFSVDGSNDGSGSESGGSTGLYMIFLGLVVAGAAATFLLADPADVNPPGRGEADTEADAGPPGKLPADAVSERSSFLAEAGPAAGMGWDAVRATLAVWTSPSMLMLAPMFWTSGGNEPYILSGFTDRWFEKRATGMEMVWYFSLSVGGSLVSGRMLDAASARGRARAGALGLLAAFTAVHCGGFVCAAIVEVSDRWEHRYRLSEGAVVLPSVAFALWGLSDAMINTFLYWLVGRLYPGGASKARAIGWFKMLNSAAHVVGYAILPTHRVSAEVQLWYNVAAFVVGVPFAASVCCRALAPEGTPPDDCRAPPPDG